MLDVQHTEIPRHPLAKLVLQLEHLRQGALGPDEQDPSAP